jgi:hypothetical protein
MTLRASEERLAAARAAEAALTHRGLAAETRLAALGDAIGKLVDELRELAAQLTETERALNLLPAPELARTPLEGARAEAASAPARAARAVLYGLAHETTRSSGSPRLPRRASVGAAHDDAAAQRHSTAQNALSPSRSPNWPPPGGNRHRNRCACRHGGKGDGAAAPCRRCARGRRDAAARSCR